MPAGRRIEPKQVSRHRKRGALSLPLRRAGLESGGGPLLPGNKSGIATGAARLDFAIYTLRWDIAIDGYLTGSSRATAGSREKHRVALDRAFGVGPEAKRMPALC